MVRRAKEKTNRKGERRVDNISPNDRVLGDFEILTLLLYQTRGCTQLPAEQGLMAHSLPFPSLGTLICLLPLLTLSWGLPGDLPLLSNPSSSAGLLQDRLLSWSHLCRPVLYPWPRTGLAFFL